MTFSLTTSAILAVTVLSSVTGCSIQSKESPKELSQEFKDYWYSGKAELTRYKLEQVRYGEIHEGDAVLIYVTEDFLTDKQVKYENSEPNRNTTSVMKLNFTRKFITGIYPYSVMTSVFTPVDLSQPTLKTTTSAQEWCGHTYSQLNHRSGRYEGQLFSYFQDEGDRNFSVDHAMLDDEIWTKIRINPSSLQTGHVKLIPGSQFLRFRHQAFGAEDAITSLEVVTDTVLSSNQLIRYHVAYKDFTRVLEIICESEFPYAILAWEEQTQSGFGESGILTTRASMTHRINSPYWEHNSVADTVLRKELGLRMH
jgi:hypothetical protein